MIILCTATRIKTAVGSKTKLLKIKIARVYGPFNIFVVCPEYSPIYILSSYFYFFVS